MRATPPAKTPAFLKTPPCPDYADLSKPAKERIALAARRCFMAYGIYVPLREIAQMAESNEATAIKYYQSHSGLVHAYVQDLIKENEVLWKEAEAEHPNDPEGQLRSWIKYRIWSRSFLLPGRSRSPATRPIKNAARPGMLSFRLLQYGFRQQTIYLRLSAFFALTTQSPEPPCRRIVSSVSAVKTTMAWSSFAI